MVNVDRLKKGILARDFFMTLINADSPRVIVENPVPMSIFMLPEPTQIIQPFEFGEPYSKKTCLWIKGCEKLKPTTVLTEYKPYVSCGTSKNKGNKEKAGVSRAGGASKIRSKSFQGIAQAMANQWGSCECVAS